MWAIPRPHLHQSYFTVLDSKFLRAVCQFLDLFVDVRQQLIRDLAELLNGHYGLVVPKIRQIEYHRVDSLRKAFSFGRQEIFEVVELFFLKTGAL